MNNKIYVSQNLDINGSSFHGISITVDPKSLLKVLGDAFISDDYKVSREWVCEYDGEVFTVYDWKQTSLYEPDCPTPDEYWSQSLVELNIGSRVGGRKEVEFASVLMNEIKHLERK